MPSNFTENYNLSQWEKSDKIQMEDFNADNAKIDRALAGKAEQSALNALSQTVNNHTAMLNRKGNCRIWTTSYTGDGTYGEDHPKTFTFPGKPLLVVISNLRSSNCLVLVYGVTRSFAIGETEARFCVASWSGNTLFLTSTQGGTYQMNHSNTAYSVVVLMAADA